MKMHGECHQTQWIYDNNETMYFLTTFVRIIVSIGYKETNNFVHTNPGGTFYVIARNFPGKSF